MKSKAISFFISVLLILFIHSCKQSGSTTTSDEMAVQAGRQIAAESFRELSGHLGTALEEGGVSHAIEFCSVEAIPITRQLSGRFGVEIKRATHKPRNPVNEATGKESEIISGWQKKMENRNEIKPEGNRLNICYLNETGTD